MICTEFQDKQLSMLGFGCMRLPLKEDGSIDEVQTERCYSKDELSAALEQSGFELIGFFGDWEFGAPKENCERWYIVARVKK